MTYGSEFTPTFLKLLRKLDRQIKERILKAVEDIVDDPRRGLSLYLQKMSVSSGGLEITE